MQNTYIQVTSLELYKEDGTIFNIYNMLAKIQINESINDVIPTMELILNNDSGKFNTLGLTTDDIIGVGLNDAYGSENKLLFKVFDYHTIFNQGTGDIRDNFTNKISIIGIPAYLKYVDRMNIYDSWDCKTVEDILKDSFSKVNIRFNAIDFEESINEIRYYSHGTLIKIFKYLKDHCQSSTLTPYILLIKNKFNGTSKPIIFKSIGKIFQENIAEQKSLYFDSDSDEKNLKILSNENNFIIIDSTIENVTSTELLYSNKLVNTEAQEINLYRGTVEIKEDLDIRDIFLNEELLPRDIDDSNEDNIKIIQSTYNECQFNVYGYFRNKFINKGLKMNSFIFKISPSMNLHICDIVKIKSTLTSQKKILANSFMVIDTAIVMNKEQSEMIIKIIPVDKSIISPSERIANIKMKPIKIGGITI